MDENNDGLVNHVDIPHLDNATDDYNTEVSSKSTNSE